MKDSYSVRVLAHFIEFCFPVFMSPMFIYALWVEDLTSDVQHRHVAHPFWGITAIAFTMLGTLLAWLLEEWANCLDALSIFRYQRRQHA